MWYVSCHMCATGACKRAAFRCCCPIHAPTQQVLQHPDPDATARIRSTRLLLLAMRLVMTYARCACLCCCAGGFQLEEKETYYGLRVRHRTQREFVILAINITVGASGSVLVTIKSTE